MATTSGTFPPGQTAQITAQILVFPFRERMAAKALPEQKFAAMEAVASRHPVAAATGSWYHDEAISEEAGNSS